MKKVLLTIIIFCLVLGMVSARGSQESASDSTGIRVAYIAKNTVDAFHATLNGAAKDALDALVADGAIESWQLYDGLTDPITQVNLLGDAITNGANFVILLPAESEGSAPVVARCKEEGIPIIVVNSTTNNTASMATAFVGSDDVEAGEIMANFVKAQLPGGGLYAHMMGVVGNSAQIARGQGIANILGNDPDWESVGDFPADWSADKAVGFATDVITEHGESLVAIICDNDDMSSAVQNYVNSIGREDIVSIGVDGNAGPLGMVKAGSLRSTVLQDGAAQVKTAISLIPDVIAGRTVPKETMVPFTLVTAENVDQYLK